jgi:pathogenesis-related protein 1
MEKLSPAYRLVGFVVLALISFHAGLENASGQRRDVDLTFTNETDERCIVRRVNARGKPVGFKSDAALPGGATVVLKSTQGDRFLVLSGKREIGKVIAGETAQQHFSIHLDRQGLPSLSGDEEADRTGSLIDGQQAAQMVDFHNRKRAEAGVGPVTWSPEIARFAQTRADTIARTKQFAHLPHGRNAFGENLAQGGRGGIVSGFTVIDACESWYVEKAKMPGEVRVMSPELFNLGVGHYTQMVWKGTTEIGAGIAHYQQEGVAMTVVVCCYNPPGNMIGGSIF